MTTVELQDSMRNLQTLKYPDSIAASAVHHMYVLGYCTDET